MKKDHQTFEVEGKKVELTRIPVRRYNWDHRTSRKPDEPFGHPREQALYEIRIDGELVGLAHRQHGFGKQAWNIDRLCPHLSFTDGLGDETVTRKGKTENSGLLLALDDVAQAAVELRTSAPWGGRPALLSTEKELEDWVVEYHREQEREEAAADKRREEHDAEIAERKRAGEAERQHIREGLQSLDERFSSSMTNHEADALRLAIAAYSKKNPS